jgi:hypothetical protein
VNHNRERQQPVDRRQAQVAELLWLRPIRDSLIGGRRRRIGEDLLAAPQTYQTPGTSLAVSRTYSW